jgi:hypothetical protein
MLTPFKTIESQAVLLAACPRPHTLSVSPVITMSAASAPSEWSGSAPIAATASVRVPGLSFSGFGGAFGYAALPAPMARVLEDFATDGGNGKGNARRIVESGATSTTKQQDQNHLTPRREPVTWRPPR